MDERGERDKLFFYDGIADSFDSLMNRYDLETRLKIVFKRFLSQEKLVKRTLLDIGCGTGWFSERAVLSGAWVVALDIGVNLLRKVRDRCSARIVAGNACCLPFPSSTFDIVVSSECIEHTVDPFQALKEMCRVLRPGGTLILTVPNRLWKFSLMIANLLKVRSYQGYEHWLSWKEIRCTLEKMNMTISSMCGFHLFPPIIQQTWPFLKLMDHCGQLIGPLMLNIAVKARK